MKFHGERSESSLISFSFKREKSECNQYKDGQGGGGIRKRREKSGREIGIRARGMKARMSKRGMRQGTIGRAPSLKTGKIKQDPCRLSPCEGNSAGQPFSVPLFSVFVIDSFYVLSPQKNG